MSMSDDEIVNKLGVSRALLAEERRLAKEIDNAKKSGDTGKVAELMARLIAVQREQPQIGPRFG
jgi:hypothetical protein